MMCRHVSKQSGLLKKVLIICIVVLLSGGLAVPAAAKAAADDSSAQTGKKSQAAEQAAADHVSLTAGQEVTQSMKEIYPQYENYSGEMEGVSVNKLWTGDAEYDRPDSVTFDLYLDGKVIDTLTLTAEDDWTGSFADHYPAYKLDANGDYELDEDGNKILLDYQVKEREVENYKAAYSQSMHQTTIDASDVHLFVPATELKEGEQYIAVSSSEPGQQKIYRGEAYQTDRMLSTQITVSDKTIKDKEGNSYGNYVLMNDVDGTYEGLLWNAYNAGDEKFYLFSNIFEIWGECHGLIEMKSTQNKMAVPHVDKLGKGTDVDSQGFFNAGGDVPGNAYKTTDSSEVLYLYREVTLPDGAFNSWQLESTVSNRYDPPITIDPDSDAASEKNDLSVSKTWKNDSESDRPSEITVHLYADGTDTGKTVTLSAANGWKASFDELDVYKDGKKISYSVSEDVPEGYSAGYRYDIQDSSGSGSETKGSWVRTDKLVDGETYLIVTSPGTGSVTGMEIQEDGKGFKWTDAGKAGKINVEGPITINGQTYTTHITQEEAEKHTRMQWTAHYKGESKGSGEQAGYHKWFTLESVSNPGCYPKFNGQGDISDGSAQESYLYYGLQYKTGSGGQNGYVAIDEKGNTQITPTVNDYPNDFSYVFGNHQHYFLLSNNHTGDANAVTAQTFYLYRFIPSTGPSVTITNTKSEETSLTVYKNWNDNNNEAGSRPDKISVVLLENGKETGKTAELSSENGWKYTFEGLPKLDEKGKEIKYSAKERDLPEGYTSSIVTGTSGGEEEIVEYSYAWVPVTEMQDGKQYILAGDVKGTPATIGVSDKGKATLSGSSVTVNTDKELTGEDGSRYTAYITDADASKVTIWTAHKSGSSVKLETGGKYLKDGKSDLQDSEKQAAALQYDSDNHALKTSGGNYLKDNGDFNSDKPKVETYLYERVTIKNTTKVDSTQNVTTITNTYKDGSGSFILRKLDGSTGNKLTGDFSFTLRDAKGSVAGNYQDVRVDDDGRITFRDLPYGDYELEETNAADGYTKLPAKVGITVSKDGITLKNADKVGAYVEVTEDSDGIIMLDVKNYKGADMPETGGRGALQLMLLGAGLLTAGVLLTIKNRKRGVIGNK